MTEQTKMKILVVDDDALARDMLGYILESEGYPVETADDGISALEKYRSVSDIELIIADVIMPHMTGIKLLKEVRADNDQIPFIILTGTSDVTYAIEALKYGANDYLLKDENIDQTLLVSVDKVLEKKRLKDQNFRLMADLAGQNSRLEAMYDIAVGLMGQLELDDLLGTILVRAAGLIETDHGFFFLVNEDADALELVIGIGLFNQHVGYLSQKGQGITGKVWQSGEPMIVNDYQVWPGSHPDAVFNFIESIIALPIKLSGGIAGIIGLVHADKGPIFSPDDINTINQFATLASLAFKNASLYKAVQDKKDALQESELKYRTIMETAAIPFVTYNLKGEVIYFNPAFTRVFGWTLDELQGKKIDFVPEQNVSETEIAVKTVYEKGGIRFETKRLTKDGRILDVDINANLYLPRPEKEPMGIMVSLKDITVLKKAKDAAEEANMTKSSFLANMSHEIRTPLNGVIAAAELALGESLSPKLENYLRIINNSGHALLMLINDILDLSKIEAGQLELEDKPFRLIELVEKVIDIFTSKADKKGIELLVDMEPGIVSTLMGDSLRLHQILVNLVGNALKFSESGGLVKIGVRCLETGQDSVKYEFSVKDTGLGIAPEFQDRLFQPFCQADASITRRYGGTGLGLCISRQLVEKMNGQIRVKSELGKGSTFYFTACFRYRIKMPGDDYILPNDMAALQVLLVEDRSDTRMVLERMLEEFNCRVTAIPSGEEALKLLEEHRDGSQPFDLLITDWLMPGTSGIAITETIRSEWGMSLPVILISGFAGEEEIEQGQDAGINHFLAKPITMSSLFDAIMDVFGRTEMKRLPKKKGTYRTAVYMERIRGLRILVAEDNPTNQEIAQAVLEKVHIMVDIAANGREAVKMVQQQQYDAVFMDVQMPEMDGYEATRIIRKWESGEENETGRDTSRLPIIAMTAHAMKGDEEKCLDAGMDGYTSKPINQEHLFHTLARLTGKPENRDTHGTEPEQETVIKKMVQKRAIAGSAPSETLPSTLPGIEIERTMKRLKFDPELFRTILIKFLQYNQDTGKEIQRLFKERDREALQKISHSLSGSGGNIGATKLQETAGEVESACRRSPYELPGFRVVEKMIKALEQVLSSLQQLYDSDEKEILDDAPVSWDGTEAAEVLQALADAVKSAVPKEIDHHLKIAMEKLGTARMKAVLDHIESFDYDEAVNGLKAIAGEEGMEISV